MTAATAQPRWAQVSLAQAIAEHAASQDRIDLLDHLPHRLGDVSSEGLRELRQYCGPFLAEDTKLGREVAILLAGKDSYRNTTALH